MCVCVCVGGGGVGNMREVGVVVGGGWWEWVAPGCDSSTIRPAFP